MAIAAERVAPGRGAGAHRGRDTVSGVELRRRAPGSAKRVRRAAAGAARNRRAPLLSASYEIDLWGGNAAGVRSAEASLRANRFDQETVRLTLVAGVASGYFQVLSLRGRLAIARENLAIAERVFKVVDARARNGAASALDVARQQAAVLTLRAAIPPLELQERQTLYALAILPAGQPERFRCCGLELCLLRCRAARRSRASGGTARRAGPTSPAPRRNWLRPTPTSAVGTRGAAAHDLAHRVGGARERRADEFPQCTDRYFDARRVAAAADLRRRAPARAGRCGSIARARNGRKLPQSRSRRAGRRRKRTGGRRPACRPGEYCRHQVVVERRGARCVLRKSATARAPTIC